VSSGQCSVIRPCRAAEIFDDPLFPALAGEAAAECANRALSAPSPDRAVYEALEQSGMAHCFRGEAAGELAGFALVLVAPSGHNSMRYATVESLFVSKQHRPGGLGARLMEAVEAAAREAGSEAVFYSAHVGSSLARLLFLSSDRYTNTNHIFCRRLA
jgi:GNAT superfamily N-acetyltransferase